MELDDETQRAVDDATAPTSTYYAALRALTTGSISGSDMVLIARIAQRVNLPSMIQLARVLDDWCPWVPLLVLVRNARGRFAFDEDLRAAEHNIRLVARRMLDAQGLRRVRVDDVLARPAQLQSAVRDLCQSPRQS